MTAPNSRGQHATDASRPPLLPSISADARGQPTPSSLATWAASKFMWQAFKHAAKQDEDIGWWRQQLLLSENRVDRLEGLLDSSDEEITWLSNELRMSKETLTEALSEKNHMEKVAELKTGEVEMLRRDLAQVRAQAASFGRQRVQKRKLK